MEGREQEERAEVRTGVSGRPTWVYGGKSEPFERRERVWSCTGGYNELEGSGCRGRSVTCPIARMRVGDSGWKPGHKTVIF